MIDVRVLAAYLPQDRLRALAQDAQLPTHTSGSALFADISGFTPLFDSLAARLSPQRAAEEMTRLVSQVYESLIGQVEQQRGSISGFVGDAITCWFDDQADSSAILHPASLRAASCALAMQHAMAAFAAAAIMPGVTAELAIKIGLASGPARRFVVGDPARQQIDVLAGETLRHMAQAEGLAQKGEIVLAPSARNALAGQASVSLTRVQPDSGAAFAVLKALSNSAEANPWPTWDDVNLSVDQLRPWVLEPLYTRLTIGEQEARPELRPIVALFLRFSGIDYDTDAAAGSKLDGFIRWVQQIAARHSGHMIQLTIGDKGSFLYVVFGALAAHDDDAVRAVRAAEALLALPESLNFITVQIGLAYGPARTGSFGSSTRRTYGAISSDVVLAARLMTVAPPGEMRCSYPVYRQAAKQIDFESMPAVRVKGRTDLIPVYRPTFGTARAALPLAEMVGRRAELAALDGLLADVRGGATRVALIEGEAGIGKSRLVDEVKRRAQERGLTWLVGSGQSIEQHTPYRAWRDVFSTYFGLDTMMAGDERCARVETVVRQLLPEHVQRLPVLNDVLGLGLPENDLTQALDANLRHQNVTLVLTALLRARVSKCPVVLILEDAHWLDGLSWQLAIQVVRVLSLSNAPLLLVLANRPLFEANVGLPVFTEFRALSIAQSLALSALTPAEITALIANRLQVSPDALPAPLIELVQARANGNPFFAEELVFDLRDNGILTQPASRTLAPPASAGVTLTQDLSQTIQTLPDTLHGLILTRIDRLPPERQFVVKVAAVIGRAFAFAPLQHVVTRYLTLLDESLKAHLTALTTANFTFLETLEPELTYIFKHIITQEAAYQTLLFEQRRELHRLVAEWYESSRQSPVARQQSPTALYPLLAYHYRYAEDVAKERYFLELAGDAAEKVYANDAAIGFYTRLLTVLNVIASEAKPSPTCIEERAVPQTPLPAITKREQAEILLKRGKLFGLVGRWTEAEEDYHAALTLGDRLTNPDLMARSQFALGTLLFDRGSYAEALDWAKRAQAGFEALSDLSERTRALILQGNALRARGDYAAAREVLELGLRFAREAHEKMIIMDACKGLANLDELQGDILQAKAGFEEALSLARELNQKIPIAIGLNNVAINAQLRGDLAAVQPLLEESLAIRREVGDKFRTAFMVLNLGVAARDRNDPVSAQRFFEEGLTLMREIGGQAGIAFALHHLGDFLNSQGNYAQAEACLQESVALYQAIGDKAYVAVGLGFLGTLARRQGNYSAAHTFLQTGLALQREIGVNKDMGETLNDLGELSIAQGAYANARVWLEAGLAYQRQLGRRRGIASALNNLAWVAIGQGDYQTARTLYQDSLPIVRETKMEPAPMHVLIGLTVMLIQLGLNTDAARFCAALEVRRASSWRKLDQYQVDIHEHTIAHARAALSPAEFDAAWAEGAQLTLDQAIDEALKLTEKVV